ENVRARGIKAENIEAQSITAEEIAANAITANKIQAGAVTAEKIAVDQLSAISANLGFVDAGVVQGVVIIGSTINNGNGTFTVGENGHVTASSINITGGNITGASNINVTSNVNIGRQLIMNPTSFT